MKATYNATKMYLVLLMVAILFGCNKDIVTYDKIQKESDVSTAPPAISAITKVDRTTALTEADLSQLVMIQGTNLSGLKSIKFNDIDADLSQAYVKAKEIIVPVPRLLPGTVNNK